MVLLNHQDRWAFLLVGQINLSIRFYVPWLHAKPTKAAPPLENVIKIFGTSIFLNGSFNVNKNKQMKQANIAIKTTHYVFFDSVTPSHGLSPRKVLRD